MDVRALLVNEIIASAVPLTGGAADYSSLFKMIGDAQFVLIGEATHGTDEFYRVRAEITKELIQHHGFCGVAVEADWPDSYRVNRYVRGDANIANAHSALAEFTRFPAWMWRNEVMVEFADWLRDYNRSCATDHEKTGFYGLDVYSLRASIKAVIAYLDGVDAEAARRARAYYGCFDRYDSGNPQEYGYASAFGLTPSCEREAVQQLVALRHHAFDYMQRNGFVAGEEFFCAEQNAKVIVDAEKYYRAMFAGRASSWNLRDKHMVETLYALADHLGKQRGERAKIVVWAHNSHVGDARATEMGESGEWNIGQLVRESRGRDAALIGFSTCRGTVTAASEWDGAAERKAVRPSMQESYEALFHETGLKKFLLQLRDNKTLIRHLSLSRLQRAIGVIYLPETERQSHYFFSRLPEQFDAIIHIDETQALKPLEPSGLWHKGEAFETYPTGL
ncbi:MAG: erythromycin esterase family protein [Alphaproteobacteria bacterium]|nr:erythromycin esterase family protein [Alphaproteobacteria bacterium]